MFTSAGHGTLAGARHNAKYGNRCVPSQRGPVDRPDAANGRLMHASVLTVKPAAQTRAELAQREERVKAMFENMTAHNGPMPSARMGRGGVDITTTDNYRVLAGLPVDPDKRNPVVKTFNTIDEARRAQSRVNIYAKAGAGTFSTSVVGNRLFIVRTASEYKKQRAASTDSF